MEKHVLDQLLGPKRADLVVKLQVDIDSRLEMERFIGQELQDSKTILIGSELNQIISITSQATFSEDENEHVAVGVMMLYCLQQPEILPKVTEHKGKALAARCLISLSLFRPALQRLCDRFGAPDPHFYVSVGKSAFQEAHMSNVAHNFERWNSFLAKEFA